MKKYAKLLALLTALTLLFTCSVASAESAKMASIKEKGKIIMATDAMWAPFEYIGEKGEPSGVDIDIAQYIADQIGVELEVLNVSFDSLTTYLVNDEADIVLAAMTITEERAETVNFSNSYTVSEQYIVVPEEDEATQSIEDLAGKAIGVHLGTTGDFLISDEISLPGGALENTGASVVQYKSLADAMLAMKNGELGAVVCDMQLAMNLVSTNSGTKCFPAVYADGSKTDEYYGAAMKKGDDEFVQEINDIMQPIIDDGTIDEWIVKHSEISSQLG